VGLTRAGQVISTLRGNVGQSTYTYSPERGWLTRIQSSLPANAFLDFTYRGQNGVR
jgi:hypothetical protein